MAYLASIGFFDGLHLGHRYVIDNLLNRAEQEGLSPMLVTFADHPRLTLEGKMPKLLLTREEREQALKQCGVSQVIEFNFPVIQNMTAQEFMLLLRSQCDVQGLLLGYDQRFGRDLPRQLQDYEHLAAAAGIGLWQLPQAPEGNISSTLIRNALSEGRIEDANTMLGYSYCLTGTVIHGRHLGTGLGFPTANLQLPPDKLIPRNGVYAAYANHQPAILNIGTNPTVAANNPTTVEVHIPGVEQDLYDTVLRVEPVRYMREEKRFDDMQQLQQQIQTDIGRLARYL